MARICFLNPFGTDSYDELIDTIRDWNGSRSYPNPYNWNRWSIGKLRRPCVAVATLNTPGEPFARRAFR